MNRLKYVPLFLLIGSYLLLMHVRCGPNTDRENVVSKRILIFVDAIKGNEDIFVNNIFPKIQKLLKRNIDVRQLFTLEVYPITNRSADENELINYELNTKAADDIYLFQGKERAEMKKIKNQWEDHLFKFNNRDTIISVLSTIPLLKKRLKYAKEKEDIKIIYISDMLEIHNPRDETNGYFSFLEKGGRNLDGTSLAIATQQISENDSPLGELISAYKIEKNNVEISIFKPGLIKPISPRSNRFISLDNFWVSFFKAINVKIDIRKLGDLKTRYTF